MFNLDNALALLRIDILKLAQLEHERIDLLNQPLNAAMKDERDQILKSDIERQHQLLKGVLKRLIEFPPHHVRHEQLLAQFHTIAKFDDSVFVMTKFPDEKSPASLNAQLGAVIQAVRDTCKDCGFVARVASDNPYHPLLWDNVELYLLGCQRGIAIVEDKYLPELNPNVAMEWGWMRGMGRNVLYLIEKDFKKKRADWDGLIESPFDWSNPLPGIKGGIESWLKKKP